MRVRVAAGLMPPRRAPPSAGLGSSELDAHRHGRSSRAALLPPAGDAGEGTGGRLHAAVAGRERREAARVPPEPSRAKPWRRRGREEGGMRARRRGEARRLLKDGRSRGGGAAGEEGKDPVRRSERREGEKKRKERRKEGMTGGPHLVVVGIE